MDSDIVVTETPSLGPNTNIDMDVDIEMDSSSSFMGLNWSKIFKYSIVILILVFLGFNLFNYLGKGFESIADLFRPILGWFGYGVGETVKSTVSSTAIGTKSAVDVTAKTLTSGIDLLEKELTGKVLKDAVIRNQNTQPEPDDASSTTQSSKIRSKAGYCYIGEDRGFRSCIEVGEGDKCMSGNIFPTMEICVNPSLRP